MDYRDDNDGWWKFALGAVAVGVIALAFRGALRGGSLEAALEGNDRGDGRDLRRGAGSQGFVGEGIGEYADDDEEPVLGYDGMDRDSLIEWLRDASLDEETLLYIERYERARENREPVLDAVGDLLASFG